MRRHRNIHGQIEAKHTIFLNPDETAKRRVLEVRMLWNTSRLLVLTNFLSTRSRIESKNNAPTARFDLPTGKELTDPYLGLLLLDPWLLGVFVGEHVFRLGIATDYYHSGFNTSRHTHLSDLLPNSKKTIEYNSSIP